MEHKSAKILESFPAQDEAALDRTLAPLIAANPAKIVVLDDDPTGVQTVHGVSVYTDWFPESMLKGFEEPGKLFYVLTNSRGMTAAQSEKAHREMAAAIVEASKKTGRDFIVISRSDSTLRGHFPLETATLRAEVEKLGAPAIDGEIICPFFREGGRFTLGDVHYVRYGDDLVPAGETEFAKDRTFGYRASNIRDYVEEKTGGACKAGDVISIPLEALRANDFEAIENLLLGAKDFQKIVLNAIDYCDVKAFAIPLYRALAKGRHFMFRSAAGLVKALGGIPDRPLLTRRDLIKKESGRGGMVVVGSHTKKTTAQLKKLLELPDVAGIELDSDLVLEGDEALEKEEERVRKLAEKLILEGRTPVCYTRRTLLEIPGDSKDKALLRSVKISDAVQSLVGRLEVEPAFVVAKGGITSSDVGVKALKVKRADVLGQIRPGIPVWRTGPESRFPEIPYVIFPGNVGEDETLKEAVEILLGK